MNVETKIHSSFFKDDRFVRRLYLLLDKKVYLKEEFIIDIFTNMKKKDEKLHINIFCAIIDKLYNPYITYADITAITYMFAIRLWDNYIIENNSKDNKSFSCKLLISPYKHMGYSP